MSESIKSEVDLYAQKALWYVFGRHDAGDRSVDEWAFAHHYRVIIGNFLAGVTNHHPSIQDAYREFQKGSN